MANADYHAPDCHLQDCHLQDCHAPHCCRGSLSLVANNRSGRPAEKNNGLQPVCCGPFV